MKLKNISRTTQRLYSIYTTGPQGVDGRLPRFSAGSSLEKSNSVVITDPYVIYQTYVSANLLERDEAQIRVMKEFQKLYYRVIDYKPPDSIAIRISLLLRKLEIRQAEESSALKSIRNQPFYRIKGWFRKDIDTQKKELVRYMTDEEELHNIAAPQGLLVNGEVGCGKSMLMDIFANSLPHQSKMRWHYNNFILWVFGEIHRIQKERMLTASLYGKHRMTMENEFILFEIAQKMIKKSTIFLLDEFMLPDVASAQIVRILFTYYFKMGGVLVATSNKLPEELYSNEFNKSRFKSFVGILGSRCVSVDMKSARDYRSHLAEKSSNTKNLVVKANDKDHEREWNRLVKSVALEIDNSSPLMDSKVKITDLDSQPASISVYNRQSYIPHTFNDQTVCYLDFDYICRGLFSSSDYISLASVFRTVIVDNVPVMTTKMKNEARRFITLLDALYEAKCQFFMRSEAEIDKLFFPEENGNLEDNYTAVQQEEMFAKTAIATMNPYRPNISSYDQEYAKEFEDMSTERSNTVNFSNTRAFTGEDEKFAYKRAVSRISEMVGSDHWRASDRWTPIDKSMRPWEEQLVDESEVHELKSRSHYRTQKDSTESGMEARFHPKELKQTLKNILPRDASAMLNVTFTEFNRKAAPSFPSIQHFWALGTWTAAQRKRIKDKIAQKWVSGSTRKEN
ncbi:hypothetical protein CJI97_004730 [Candidozyma auris]|nr:hypothetical protein CJI97_004730 [[Candida] auris]